MEFNSNEEYLKAFPPNFGPKLEPPKKIRRSKLDAERFLANTNQNLEFVPEKLVEEQKLAQEDKLGDNNEDASLGEREMVVLSGDLAPVGVGLWDQPCLGPPLMPQGQLDDDMVDMPVDDGDGDGVESTFLADAIKETTSAALPLSQEVKEQTVAVSIEATAMDPETIRQVKDKAPTLAADIISHAGAKDVNLTIDSTTAVEDPHLTVNRDQPTLIEESTGAAGMDAETVWPSLLIEIVETTTVDAESVGRFLVEKPNNEVEGSKGDTMDVKADSQVSYQRPTFGLENIDDTIIRDEAPNDVQVEETTRIETFQEASTDADTILQIEVEVPTVEIQVVAETTMKDISFGPTDGEEPALTIDASTASKLEAEPTDPVEIGEPPLALEVVEETAIKVMGISNAEAEIPCLTVEVIKNISIEAKVDEEFGTCSSEYIDNVVDKIMDDIAVSNM